MKVGVEITGVQEIQKGLTRTAQALSGAPMIGAMRESTMLITAEAKRGAPADTGRLRASITPEVRPGNPIEGIVGSNVEYAPYMELGTKPHWPPWGPGTPLAIWAKRHGISAYLVARAISKKGTKARRFLQEAYENNQKRIFAIFEQAVGRIIARK